MNKPASSQSPGMRPLLLGLLIVAVALSIVGWLTQPEAPPSEIDGVEVSLTDESFETEILEHSGFALVDFWFEGCAPCRRMKPVIAHLSVNYRDRVKIGKLDVDQYSATPIHYGLQGFPTLLLFQDGEVIARWEGYGGLQEMSDWLDEQLAAHSAGGAGDVTQRQAGDRRVAGDD